MKAFMGTMVGVKPMGDFSNETGMPAVLGNARGYKNGYYVLKEFVKNIIGESKDKIILVTHSIRQQQADEVVRILREELTLAKVIPCRVGQSSGTNVGPGLIAAFFLADKPVSPNCVEEKKLVASLLNKKA